MNKAATFPNAVQRCLVLFLTAFLAGMFRPMLAELAISAPGQGELTRNTGVSNTYGWIFTVGSSDLRLNGLGIFDAGSNGLVASHPIGIWDAHGGLLTTIVIPSGTSAPLIGQFRVLSLPTPLTLPAGTSYTIGALYRGDDELAGSFSGPPLVSPYINNLEARFTYGVSLLLPDRGPQPGAGPTPYVGPTFSFLIVPEPSVIALVAIASLVGLVQSRKSCSQKHP